MLNWIDSVAYNVANRSFEDIFSFVVKSAQIIIAFLVTWLCYNEKAIGPAIFMSTIYTVIIFILFVCKNALIIGNKEKNEYEIRLISSHINCIYNTLIYYFILTAIMFILMYVKITASISWK
jgi:hypothetical protein